MGLLDEFYAPDNSKLKRGQFRQDTPRMREYAANVPVDLGRGTVAGLLGLLSDTLNFAPAYSPKPMEQFGDFDYAPSQKVPYGSEEFLKTLPLAPAADNPVGRVAGQIGTLAPMVPIQAARLAGRGATKLGKFVAPKAGQLAEGYMQRMGMMPGIVPVGASIKDAGKVFPTSITNKSEVRNVSDDFADQFRQMGFDVTVDHSGSKAGASSYLKVSDPQTGRFLSKPIRISDHSKGAKELDANINVLNPQEDFAKITSALNDMRAKGDSLVFKQDKYAQELIASGVKPKTAYQRSRIEITENAAEEGGGLLGDAPTAKASFKYPQQAALDLAQQRAALPVEQGGLGLLANNTAEERAAAMGATDWFHGTDRLDRLLEKKNIDARRATSGPMPYGTNEPTLASNYSMNKADTSRIASDTGEMQNYFQVFPKTMGERGTAPYSVEHIWNRLPQEKKAEILDKAKRVGFEDFDELSGPLKLHPEGVNAMNVSEDTWNYYLNRESKGNPLTALRKLWGESGMLYNEEQKLADIYKLAGFPYEISQTNAPWTSAKGVMTGKAIIPNPLDTSNVSEMQDKVIPFLKEQFKNDRTRAKTYGADQWDKNTRFTPKQWVSELEKDIESGKPSYVWTSIPDKVTNALKKAGYNGIIDKSGKGGGPISDVIIPFEPEQLRSRFAAFDPWRKTAAIAATMGVAAPDLLAADLQDKELRKQMQSYGLLY